MTIVVDASVVVALLVDQGPDGEWAEQVIADTLVAPELMPLEAANILRLGAVRGDISWDVASLAHADLVAIPVELFPYEPFGERIWESCRNLTAYDAWYVALAEALAAPFATLDRRLARATGPRCRFVAPPA